MQKLSFAAVAAIGALCLNAPHATANGHLATRIAQATSEPGTQGGLIPGSMQDERRPASSGEDDLDVGRPTAETGTDTTDRDETKNVQDTTRPNPREDDAVDASTGRRRPDAADPDVVEGLDVEGKRGGIGTNAPAGDRYDAGAMEEDAEASAGAPDYDSPLHQRNLEEAMNPRYGRYKSRSSTGEPENAAEVIAE